MSAVRIAEAHAHALGKKRAELAELEEKILELTALETAAMREWLEANPSARPDATSPPARLRRRIAETVTKRDLLAKEVRAQQELLEGLEVDADAERREQEARDAEAAISTTEIFLAEKWSGFVAACEQVRALWPGVVEMASELDSLPSGTAPLVPFPATLPSAFAEALRPSPGTNPYADVPRIVARRIATTGGGAATNLTGYAHTMQDTGDWR